MKTSHTWRSVVNWLKTRQKSEIKPDSTPINTTVLVRDDGSLFHWQGPYWFRGASSVWVSDDGRFRLTKTALWDVLDRETDTQHSFMGYAILMRWIKEQYGK